MLLSLRHHRRAVFMGLFLLLAVLYLAHIGAYHLIDPDEGRYHRIGMEMMQTGDYVTPRLDGLLYFDKPALPYWVTALSMEIFGVHDFAGRVLPALSGLGNVLLAYALGRRMLGRRGALVAAVILATTALNLIVASIGVLDMALSFFLGAALVSFYYFERAGQKKYLLGFYAAMALGMLTKGLIAIVFPVGIVLCYALLARRPRLLRAFLYWPGILLFLVLALPWYFLVCQANPDFFDYFFIREHFLRFVTKMHKRFHPWYYFLPVLVAGFVPWTGFLLSLFSKRGVVRQPGTPRRRLDVMFLLLWAGLIYLFFSVSDSKLPTYILPCWLPLSVLLAASLERCRRLGVWLGHGFLVNALLCLLFSAAGVVFLLHTDYLSVPAFLRSGALLTASLVLGTFLAAFVWHRKKSFLGVFLVLSLMSYGFGLGAHLVQGQIHEHQSSYPASEAIRSLGIGRDTPIVMYGRFMPGLIYYLDRPIAVADLKGELEFGLSHPHEEGLYFSREELADIWQSPRQVVIVMPPHCRGEMRWLLVTPPEKIIERENFTILVNHI